MNPCLPFLVQQPFKPWWSGHMEAPEMPWFIWSEEIFYFGLIIDGMALYSSFLWHWPKSTPLWTLYVWNSHGCYFPCQLFTSFKMNPTQSWDPMLPIYRFTRFLCCLCPLRRIALISCHIDAAGSNRKSFYSEGTYLPGCQCPQKKLSLYSCSWDKSQFWISHHFLPQEQWQLVLYPTGK